MANHIPFNKPYVSGNELKYINEAINSGHISGDGIFTKKCSDYLQNSLGVKKILLTTSCTHALEMTAILLNIQAEDEIIVPSYTFVSTINAFILRGAKPVFVDIRQDTLNMNEQLIESLITDKTKAIIPVHYAGAGCEMDLILHLADQYQLKVIEDNAHGLFAKYKGKFLGTFGDMSTLSFHETKNIICGEGGALIINNEEYINRAEIIREKGTNRSQFFRAETDKYSWYDIGSSYLPSDILSAYLFAQLENSNVMMSLGKKIYDTYFEELLPLQNAGLIRLPYLPKHCESVFNVFHILVNDENTRNRLIQYLREKNILAVFHYLPLHLSPFAKQYGFYESALPVTEMISKTIIRLPFFYELKYEDQKYIINNLYKFFNFE